MGWLAVEGHARERGRRGGEGGRGAGRRGLERSQGSKEELAGLVSSFSFDAKAPGPQEGSCGEGGEDKVEMANVES